MVGCRFSSRQRIPRRCASRRPGFAADRAAQSGADQPSVHAARVPSADSGHGGDSGERPRSVDQQPEHRPAGVCAGRNRNAVCERERRARSRRRVVACRCCVPRRCICHSTPVHPGDADRAGHARIRRYATSVRSASVGCAQNGAVSRRDPDPRHVGRIVRQAVLSGYPLFPSRVVSLPLDWRLPSHTVDEANRYARSWARTPRGLPASVLGSWGWFPGWLSRNGRDINVIGALALLLCAVPVSVLRRVDAQRRERSRAMWAMLGPSLVTLLLWFAIAPDPRFAYAPLWLTPMRSSRTHSRARVGNPSNCAAAQQPCQGSWASRVATWSS